ncbi:hypothetical protein ONA22_05635 [Mycoplasmopsis cynos]|nr:hypothetical protein [Mycoplasmopsis cynos]WAM04132.1 hypothetical protein ONA22_05635 [Mycoplasmopsis cynos]
MIWREKAASILIAEGQKSAEILKAEIAQSKLKYLKLKHLNKLKYLKLRVKESIDLINEANLSQSILTLKSIEQLEKLANGNATKIIIPPNLSSIASTMSVVSEVLDTKNDQKSTK